MGGILSARVSNRPLILGPIQLAANQSATTFNYNLDTPDSPAGYQVIGADLYVDTTIATQATNYHTFKVQKVATNGAGAATDIVTWTTNSSGGAAVTASARNAGTLTTTLANSRVASTDLLRFIITFATGTNVAIDRMSVNIRLTPGAAGALT